MPNLLRAQIYKLFHSKSFYIIIFINIIINILGVSMFWAIQNAPDAGNVDMGMGDIKGYSLLYMVISHGGIQIFEIIAMIFVAFFVASEFKHGNIKYEISYGYRRVTIYISKLLSSMFGVGLIIASSMLTGLVAGTAFFGFGADVNAEVIANLARTFGLIVFVSLAFCSIFVLISFIFKEPGAIMGVYIGFTVVVTNIALAQLSMRFEWVQRATGYLLQAQLYNVAAFEIAARTAGIALIYTCAVIGLSSLVGCKLFKRMDIF